MHPIINKIISNIGDKMDSNAAMQLAGIHATIISILIGFGIALALHINSQIHEVETDAMDIAENVNYIPFSPIWFKLVSPGSLLLSKWPTKEDQIPFLLSDYWLDPSGEMLTDTHKDWPFYKLFFLEMGLNHTEFKLSLIGALALKYPFPDRMVIKGKHIALQPNPSITFKNIDDLEKWNEEIKNKFRILIDNINWFGSDAFIQGFDWSKETNLRKKFYNLDDRENSGEPSERFKEIPKEFCSNISAINDISKKLNHRLERYNFLNKLNPPKKVVIFFLFISIATFFSSVVSPMIFHSISKLFVLWLPIFYYTIFLLYSSFKVISILK